MDTSFWLEKKLFSKTEISARIETLADEIAASYSGEICSTLMLIIHCLDTRKARTRGTGSKI
jgi:hypothetical protein